MLLLSATLAFQLTRLMRGVTDSANKTVATLMISTHTPHARRDRNDLTIRRTSFISTHTPHARRDQKSLHLLGRPSRISTHTPHARRDKSIRYQEEIKRKFQLTRLMRGVTLLPCVVRLETSQFQLTRLMRGVTLCACFYARYSVYFNSHASCEA